MKPKITIIRVILSVVPMVVLWYFWLAIVRYASEDDVYRYEFTAGLLAMVLAVIIRIFILRSAKYTLSCLVFMEGILLLLVTSIDFKRRVALSWTRVAEGMFQEVLSHFSTLNLIIGFVIGTFLASAYRWGVEKILDWMERKDLEKYGKSEDSTQEFQQHSTLARRLEHGR